ncbi:MAG: M23 family metallopeptidase [Clostridiales bacterium]|nr:M23 family metallopeptidase [Clostridiales bacterium]
MKKIFRSRMTYAVLLSLLVVGGAAAGGNALEKRLGEDEDPYLVLEETASPITYGGEEPADSDQSMVIRNGAASDEGDMQNGVSPEAQVTPDEETEDVYEVVEPDNPYVAGAASVFEADSGEENEQEEDGDTDTEKSEDEKSEDSSDSSGKTADVLNFTEEDSLIWPMEGEVIREFSMDTTVYYSTLDSYRVSPSILIQGDMDLPVYAAATGIVKEIGESEELGQYMVVDLGNAYELTYGQLKNISLSEGELMEEGDCIASLAEPSRYYVVEGYNLYFQMMKDGEAIDPLDYLQ